MASLLPPTNRLSPPFCRHNKLKHFQVTSQGFREDGTPANMVDANLGILRGRIAEVRMKERLDTWCRLKSGWNYQSVYDYRPKRDTVLSESLEIMGIVSRIFGLVFLSGSLCICLVSLLVHLSKGTYLG